MSKEKDKICVYCHKIISYEKDQEVMVLWEGNRAPMHYKCATDLFTNKTSPIHWGDQQIYMHIGCARELMKDKKERK